MSSIEARKIQTDELTNVAGDDLPANLKRLTPLCYGTLRAGVLRDTNNISSVSFVTGGATLTMIAPAPDAHYGLLVSRDGSNDAHTYTTNYYYDGWSDQKAKTKSKFTFYGKIDANVIQFTNIGEISFLAFSTRGN